MVEILLIFIAVLLWFIWRQLSAIATHLHNLFVLAVTRRD